MAASMRFLAKRSIYLYRFFPKRHGVDFSGTKPSTLQILNAKHVSTGNVMLNKETLSEKEVKNMMESLSEKFAEARELMEDARESQGTVYFSEDIEEAQQAVKETLDEYSLLLEKLSDQQRQNVISSLGLRMEELKAQQAAIEESLKEDH